MKSIVLDLNTQVNYALHVSLGVMCIYYKTFIHEFPDDLKGFNSIYTNMQFVHHANLFKRYSKFTRSQDNRSNSEKY